MSVAARRFANALYIENHRMLSHRLRTHGLMSIHGRSDVLEHILFVSWRSPEGSIHPIGLLRRRHEGDRELYSFRYLKLVENLPDFEPLPGLPDLHDRYESSTLFPVFANRVMPRRRPEFDLLTQRADLGRDADPFEVMARTGGRRATDRIEVFSPPRVTGEGRITSLFFVRGIRHIPGAAEVVAELAPGDRLRLVDDPGNVFNARAVLLHSNADRTVGYVPDYLVEHVHELRQLNGTDPEVLVEHVNDATAAPHLRVLCRLDAPWPEGYRPFSDARFQPLVPLD